MTAGLNDLIKEYGIVLDSIRIDCFGFHVS